MSPKKRSLLEMMDDSYLAELEDGRFAHSMESVEKLFEEVPKDNWTVTDSETGKKRAPKTSTRTPEQLARDAASSAEWAETKAKKAAAEAQAAVPADPADGAPAPEADPADGAPAPEADPATAEAKPATAEATAETPSTDPAVAPAVPEVDPEAQADISDISVKQDNDSSGRTIGAHDAPSVAGQIATGDDSDGGGDDDNTQADPDVNNPSGGLAYLDGLAQKEIDDASQTTDASKNATSESRLSLIDLLYDT